MNDTTRTLQAYLDGELTAAEAEAVRRTLAERPDWREELASLKALWEAVDAAARPQLSASVWPQVASRLAARRRASVWSPAQRGLAVAALAAGVLVGFGVASRTAPVTGEVADGASYETLEDAVPTLDSLWLGLTAGDEEADS
ncbi:MAG: hypothetical protein R3D98_10780 [Candidatus Krumholzibacteriia bacterium]